MLSQTPLTILGLTLILSGFALTLLATVLLFLGNTHGQRKTRGGFLIMIGPIPIAFGTDKETIKTLLTLAIILMSIILALLLLDALL